MDYLKKEINKNKFQIFVCASPANFPLNYFYHCFFVTNEKGKVNRYDLTHFKNKNKIHFHINYYPPFSGIEVFYRVQKWYWKGRIYKKIEGPLAKRMIDFVKKSKKDYPYLRRYNLFGPNSNTYVQWVLDNFPEAKTNLPQRSFGKNYKKRT
jgi:hypothetical protein